MNLKIKFKCRSGPSAGSRFIFWLLVLLLVGQSSLGAEDVHFQQGVAAYEAGEYETAAQAFQDSLAGKPAAGTLLNLGLAEWRSDHMGAAILTWEQSAWLNPFNREARDNLSYARETAAVSPLELTWCEQASTWLPAGCWAGISCISLWMAVAMVTLPGFFRIRKAGWHQTLAALALGIFLLSLPPSIGLVTRSENGIVLGKNTSLRLTPTQAAELVASLPDGEPVRRLRRHGDYFFVRTQYGNGWVARRQIGFLSPQ